MLLSSKTFSDELTRYADTCQKSLEIQQLSEVSDTSSVHQQMLHENKTLLGDAEYKHLWLYCPHGTSWVFLDVRTLNFLCSFISSHFWWKITADFPPSWSPLAKKSKYTPPFPFSKTRDHWEDSHKIFFCFWYFSVSAFMGISKENLEIWPHLPASEKTT